MPNNKNLSKARKQKKDEFYTQLEDIELELKHYKNYFRNKTVFCNCDDPRISAFFTYFSNHFKSLGLRKIITSCYKNQNINLFSLNKDNSAVYLEYSGEINKNQLPDISKIEIKKLKGDGDFRSEECIELLKQADIVVTNPPFSLFREYIAQLIAYDKKFLIIGNINALTYKECFSLIKDNKMWLGASIHSGDRKFGIPKDYPLKAATCGIDDKGCPFIRVKGVRWFTNLDYQARHEELPLYKKYNIEEYPKYDNYEAINVNKTADIPCDYYEPMGVPITFMDKYNPAQFEILGLDNHTLNNGLGNGANKINGKTIYRRIIIKRKK